MPNLTDTKLTKELNDEELEKVSGGMTSKTYYSFTRGEAIGCYTILDDYTDVSEDDEIFCHVSRTSSYAEPGQLTPTTGGLVITSEFVKVSVVVAEYNRLYK